MRRLGLTLAVLLYVHPVYANRVFSSGFEIGSVINGVEWNTGYLLPQTTRIGVRTGLYAGYLPPYEPPEEPGPVFQLPPPPPRFFRRFAAGRHDPPARALRHQRGGHDHEAV